MKISLIQIIRYVLNIRKSEFEVFEYSNFLREIIRMRIIRLFEYTSQSILCINNILIYTH